MSPVALSEPQQINQNDAVLRAMTANLQRTTDPALRERLAAAIKQLIDKRNHETVLTRQC